MSRVREAAAQRWLGALFWTISKAPWALDACKPVLPRLIWWSAPRPRRALRTNAARILGPHSSPGSRARLGRAVIRNFLDHVGEFGRDPRGACVESHRRVEAVTGLEHYEAARSLGRGAIVVTAHLGPFESAVESIRSREPRVHIVFRRDRFPLFEQLRARQRERLGVIEAPIDDGIPMWLRLRDALRSDEVVLMQGDRTLPGQRGFAVPFLHGHVRIPTGPARLARLTGAPIIPILALREGPCISIRVEPPIHVDNSITDEDVCARVGAIIARYVARCPEQWLMLEEAWIEDQQRPA